MYPKTRDLEIVYNLLWRSKPHQSDDRANIVGMYDIPSTTLNWETFKSYLLKNSGSNATDIKVSYLDSDDKEIAINSQNDFQLALYSFRRRARIGEIITLKVDKVNARKSITQLIQSTDVEIQTLDYKEEPASPACSVKDDETPPKWFTKHMKKFEKKIMEEMKQQFALVGSKVQSTCQHSHSSRSKATKPETYKRSRKLEYTKVNLDKDICKKYAFKLDEPEHRPSQKTKAKKLSPIKISSDSDVGRDSKAVQQPLNFFFKEPALNDALLNTSSDKTAGPLYVNSVYLQKWEVTNTGISAWDERTELRYAWGSEKLRPTFTILKCPELQPGETGEISVWFQIPSTAGSYECYWHFYDCGRRFGRWIGCQLKVVDYPRKQHSPYATKPLEIAGPITYMPVSAAITQATAKVDLIDPIDLSVSLSNMSNVSHVSSSNASLTTSSDQPQRKERTEIKSSDISLNLNALVLGESGCNNLDYTSNCEPGSDSDNISILSGAQTPHSGSSDYVLIPVSEAIATTLDKVAEIVVAGEVKVMSSQEVVAANNELVQVHQIEIAAVDEATGDAVQLGEDSGVNDAVSVASEAKSGAGAEPERDAEVADDAEGALAEIKMADVDIESTEYAYIYYNGEKYPFHKDYLRSEYFNEAEKCTPSAHSSGSISSKASINSDSLQQGRSREASTSSQESRRLFVFPRHSPGFEVVYPADADEVIPKTASSTCSYEGEEYYSIKDGFQFPPTSESNFYLDESGAGILLKPGLGASKEYVPVSQGSSNAEMYHSLTAQEVSQLLDAQTVQGVSGLAMPDVSGLAMPHTTAASSLTPIFTTCNNAENTTATPSLTPIFTTCKVAENTTVQLQQQPEPATSETKYHGRVYRPVPIQAGKRENMMTEAAILAGSAMGTMRNVVNMVMNTGNGKWVNGHWVAEGTNTKRESGLQILSEMGFMNRDLNATLLARYNDDVHRVISELVQ